MNGPTDQTTVDRMFVTPLIRKSCAHGCRTGVAATFDRRGSFRRPSFRVSRAKRPTNTMRRRSCECPLKMRNCAAHTCWKSPSVFSGTASSHPRIKPSNAPRDHSYETNRTRESSLVYDDSYRAEKKVPAGENFFWKKEFFTKNLPFQAVASPVSYLKRSRSKR